jgi:hypothetical protein
MGADLTADFQYAGAQGGGSSPEFAQILADCD